MKPRQKGLIGLIGLIGLLLAAAAGPFFIGRRRGITRRILIEAPPALVFPYLNDLRNWPVWRSWHWQSDGPHFSYAGPPVGVGATEIFQTRARSGVLRITVSEPDDHLAYTIELNDGSPNNEGVFALRTVRRGTWVRWILKWDGHKNPLLRYVDLWLMIRRGRRMSRDLVALKRQMEGVLAKGGRPEL